jgi:hypothetical protein
MIGGRPLQPSVDDLTGSSARPARSASTTRSAASDASGADPFDLSPIHPIKLAGQMSGCEFCRFSTRPAALVGARPAPPGRLQRAATRRGAVPTAVRLDVSGRFGPIRP